MQRPSKSRILQKVAQSASLLSKLAARNWNLTRRAQTTVFALDLLYAAAIAVVGFALVGAFPNYESTDDGRLRGTGPTKLSYQRNRPPIIRKWRTTDCRSGTLLMSSIADYAAELEHAKANLVT